MAIQDGSAQFEKKTVTNKEYVDLCVPVGVVQAFAGSATPAGWLLCDGSAVSRTTYADLYAVIGDTYGAGDGNTTFNLPDLVDKFVQGNATSGTEKTAGLPNITGRLAAAGAVAWQDPNISNNAFYTDGATSTQPQANSTSARLPVYAEFNASRSSSVYGNSTTVQPPAVTMRYIIKY